MITNQETIYIFSIYICVRACVTLNVTLEYTSNDLCDGVNTIENRIYLIGNIDIQCVPEKTKPRSIDVLS